MNDFDTIIQYGLNALQLGSFYALIALGYTLVYGVLRLINFAHGDIFMVGAYIAFFVSSFLISPDGLGCGQTTAFALTMILTIILTSGVGVTLERVAYRPLRRKGAHRLYVVITALMCGILLENANLALLGASSRVLPDLIQKEVLNFGAVTITNLKILIFMAAILVFVSLQLIVMKSRFGMAMRAISWDPFAIPLMGIPVDKIIVFTFILGSGVAGLGGLLYGMAYVKLENTMGMMMGWKAFIAAVVGGIGDIRGAFLGGLLLGAVEALVPAFLPSSYKDLISFSILIAILCLRPTGIFGVPQTTKI